MELKKTFQEIKNDFFEKYKEVFKNHPYPPSEEEVENQFDAIFVWGPLNGLKIHRWLIDLIDALENHTNTTSSHFYVLVNGLISSDEIQKFLNTFIEKLTIVVKSPELFERLLEGFKATENEELLLKVSDALNIIKNIASKFNEDEKAVVSFLRHGWSHPTLTKYELQMDFNLETKQWRYIYKDKHVNLMKSLKNINSCGIDFKQSIYDRLHSHIQEIRSVANFSKEMTFRLGHYEHEIFESWFNEPR